MMGSLSVVRGNSMMSKSEMSREQRALLSTGCGYSSVCMCSVCLGCMTGVGTAGDRGRDVRGRFHTAFHA